MGKNILSPMVTGLSTSPSIRRAAAEPQNWQRLGEKDPKAAVAQNPTKKPICPKENT